MPLSSLIATVVTLAVGALLSFVPTYILERRRERLAAQSKWDSALYAAANEVIAASRRAQHLADQVTVGESIHDQPKQLDEEHQRLRVAVEHIRIVGDSPVQLAAREILRYSYARLLEVTHGRDPYAKRHPGTNPLDRLREAHLEFYRAVRQQLRVPNPSDVPADRRSPMDSSDEAA